VARPAGFEPTTPWFVARASSRLATERSNGCESPSGERLKLGQHFKDDDWGTFRGS
jgi:hypothetical protein